MKHICFLLLIVLAAFLLSCGSDTEVQLGEAEKIAIQAHIDSLSFDISESETGLFSYPLTLNPGGKTQASGNVLSVFYKLSVLGGQVIDVYDSLDADTIVVKQGANAIYPLGIDEGLGLMREGEKWGFILPSDIAFGDFSFSTLIPQNSVILAEIELLEIRSEDDVLVEELEAISAYVTIENLRDTVANPLNQPVTLPTGMAIKRLREGNGTKPMANQNVACSYEATFLNGERFDVVSNTSPFEFSLGAGSVISGFELAVGEMEYGEQLLAMMPSYLAYKESAQVIPPFLTEEMVDRLIVPSYAASVPPYKPLVFKIDLIPAN